MKISKQMSIGDIDPEYQAFVDKFKPKKTTDDCYTPENIYKVVLDWVVKEYGIDPDNVKRPFWPGANYLEDEYPDGCCVVDNPPFSILSQICKTYMSAGIKFFLFAPYLTNFSGSQRLTHIVTTATITYENGAEVSTAFLTNLDERFEIRTAVDLQKAIKAANQENLAKIRKVQPKYSYPMELLTATDVGYMSTHGVEFNVPFGETFFVRTLDAQKEHGKAIYGGGFLLSEEYTEIRAAAERAAAERAAAERAAAKCWALSEREREIVKTIGRRKHEEGQG